MVGAWLRRWRRSPLLTGQFSATIVVGMGAVTALISLMLALGFRPQPYRDPGRLAAVWERVGSGAPLAALSGPDLADFSGATRNIFASLDPFTVTRVWLLDQRGAVRIRECYIEATALGGLGIRPVLGRPAREHEQPLWPSSGASPAWISYRLWRNRYGGSPSVIGTTIELADTARGSGEVQARIAGVFPPRVSIPLPFEDTTDVWCILSPSIVARSRQADVFFGLGRLRPGVSVAQAQAALTLVAERLGQRYSFDWRKRPVVRRLEAIAQGPARRTMGLLSLGLGLVFLVGCVNLAVLMGAEGRRRRREIAIRAVVGAGRARLWREVAAEKCLLTLLSLGLGAAFAFAVLRVLVWLVPAAGLGPPLVYPPPLNLSVLFGFAAFALAAALVWSALLVTAADGQGSSRALALGARGFAYTGLSDSGPDSGRWRLVLLAGQAGIGVCLLAAAALTVRTYATVSVANLGPAPSRTLLLSVSTRDNFVPTDAQVADFNRQVLSRLKRLPGAQGIALANLFPPPGWPISFMRQGDAPGTERVATWPISVSPGYFRTLGIPILFGRGFDKTDDSGSEPVAIISLNMAQRNWNSPEQAVGSHIAFGPKFQKHNMIVGVAANFTGYWHQKPIPTVYLPLAQSAFFCGGEVILRTSAPPRTVAAIAPQALAGTAIPATISGVSTMETRWRATLTRPLARVAGMLLLALVGLGLSVQGVYAVAAATVTARGHELAVRSALGALPGRLAWDATRELVLAVLVGAGMGVATALGLRPLLQHWLGPVAVWQAEPIAVAVALLALAAAAGCYLPARAAARANPAEVLRQG